MKPSEESVLSNLQDIKQHIQEQYQKTNINIPTHNTLFNRLQQLDDTIHDNLSHDYY
jgi:hypothetical protein